MSDELYHELLLDEAKHLQNHGQLSAPDLILEGRNASCGDRLHIAVRFDPQSSQLPLKNRPIIDLKWSGEGCIISRVSMSLLSQKIMSQHLSIAEVMNILPEEFLAEYGLAGITITRRKCALLSLSSFREPPV